MMDYVWLPRLNDKWFMTSTTLPYFKGVTLSIPSFCVSMLDFEGVSHPAYRCMQNSRPMRFYAKPMDQKELFN